MTHQRAAENKSVGSGLATRLSNGGKPSGYKTGAGVKRAAGAMKKAGMSVPSMRSVSKVQGAEKSSNYRKKRGTSRRERKTVL